MGVERRVRPENEGLRLDVWLKRNHPEVSRAYWEKCLTRSLVRLDGRVARGHERLRAEARIEFPEPPTELLTNADLFGTLHIAYEDEHLLAVEKPPKVPSTPLGLDERDTIANAIAAYLPAVNTFPGDPRDGGLLHRLDIGTAGLLVAAKDAETFKAARASLHQGEWNKRYLAFSASFSRPPTALEHVLTAAGPRGERMDEVRRRSMPPPRPGGDRHSAPPKVWTALSEITWRWQGRYMQAFEVRAPKAVRHQVRAQLALCEAPLLGDTLYGGVELPGYPGFALVAHAIDLPHPVTGAPLKLRARLPDRLVKALEAIEGRALPESLHTR